MPPPSFLLGNTASIMVGFKPDPGGAAKPDEYRLQHVEPLLNQAADLLERGIRDRAEWYELAVKGFNVYVDLTGFEKVDQIHQAETAAGFYKQAMQQSEEMLGSEAALRTGYDTVNQRIWNLVAQEFSQQIKHDLELQAAIAARLSQPDEGPMNPLGLGSHPRTDYVDYSARRQVGHAFITQEGELGAQQQLYQALAESSKHREAAARYKRDWDQQEGGDKGFLFRRTQASRDIFALKHDSYYTKGGALNYEQRMEPIKKRFQSDFAEALRRLEVAADGMRKLYGYTVALPKPDTDNYFDECLLWTREAINWNIRFSQLDQTGTKTFSLRTLAGTPAGQPLIPSTKGDSRTDLKFNISLDAFKEHGLIQRFVRLRGLSAFTVGAPEDLWQVTLFPPRSGTYLRATDELIKVDQSTVPGVRIGRVESRTVTRTPETVGTAGLYNASPIGDWTGSASRVSPVTSDKPVEDILLEVQIAYKG